MLYTSSILCDELQNTWLVVVMFLGLKAPQMAFSLIKPEPEMKASEQGVLIFKNLVFSLCERIRTSYSAKFWKEEVRREERTDSTKQQFEGINRLEDSVQYLIFWYVGPTVRLSFDVLRNDVPGTFETYFRTTQSARAEQRWGRGKRLETVLVPGTGT
jgi:hypothetical protein